MRRATFLMVMASGIAASAPALAASPPVDFESCFATIVVENCLACHHPLDTKGGLDLTRSDTVLRGGDSGPAIVVGNPQDSLLVQRITEGSMPPINDGPQLSDEKIAAIRAWIKSGAPWPAGRVLRARGEDQTAASGDSAGGNPTSGYRAEKLNGDRTRRRIVRDQRRTWRRRPCFRR